MKNEKMILRVFLRDGKEGEAEYLFLVDAGANYSEEFLQEKVEDIVEELEEAGNIFWTFDDVIRRLVRKGYIEEVEKVKIKNVVIYV